MAKSTQTSGSVFAKRNEQVNETKLELVVINTKDFLQMPTVNAVVIK